MTERERQNTIDYINLVDKLGGLSESMYMLYNLSLQIDPCLKIVVHEYMSAFEQFDVQEMEYYWNLYYFYVENCGFERM